MPEPLPDGTANTAAGSLPLGDDVTIPPRVDNEQASQVIAVLDGYLEALKAGERPDRQRLLAEHPQIAAQLEACLAGIEFIHGGTSGAQSSGKRLGEFRIIREIGHGGMGAVYEAEQISLGRRVALKVLRFGPVSDTEAITRFEREANTVARLHHTNIVPIFAVGSEHGVNYYAMQYIVGRSLDQVLREAGKPIPSRTVAEWGLQAAEALAHAHTRGVIHRDVKPSNLLIDDEEGRIWLTDFGLAKRLDDVTLSMTGALLGTPRYMSPEQAAAAHNKLDHRTDLYSLGATLYELATNQPVFKGDSPHNVIMQILDSEPPPPRRHLPSLPRDLDTILMKCLAKEPSQRYSSARDLADDLRAFLDNRPISARRTSFAEQAVRWVKKQQRSLVLTTAAVGITLLLVVGGSAASYFWQRSRLAFVKLDTDHPPVIAEILSSAGKTITPRTTLPMQQAAEVPAGEYRLRLSADQRFSQDLQISLTPGQQLGQKLDVNDQLLWSDFKFARSFRPVVISERGASIVGQKTDLLLLNPTGVQRCDGESRSIVWSLELTTPTHELLKGSAKARWPWDNISSVALRGVGMFDMRPFVVSAGDARDASSLDFNADGVSDLVIAPQHQAWLLAVSGRDGAPLWLVPRGDTVPREDGQPWANYGLLSAVPYAPLVVADQDGDGIADLATWFMTSVPGTNGIKRTLELISGKAGTTIWKHESPAEWFTLPPGTPPPLDFCWYHGSGGGYGSGGSGASWQGTLTRRNWSKLSRSSGEMSYLPSAAEVVATGSSKQLAFLAGTHLVRLELATGSVIGESGNVSIRPTLRPGWSDFDGDGATDVLLSEVLPDLPPTNFAKQPTPQLQVAAWSVVQQKELWRVIVEAAPPVQQKIALEAPVWPIVADLDTDGAAEILIPVASSLPEPSWLAPWGVVAALEGRTGQERWRRQFRSVDQQLDTFAAGPDVNGDGCRDVFVASLWNEDLELFLDCLSGKNGESLWRTRHATRVGTLTSDAHRLAPLTWYSGGDSRRPQLLIRLHADSSLLANSVILFSAENGEQAHFAAGILDAQSGDLDGNGVQDLLLMRPNNDQYLENGGTLHASRGTARERSRRLATGGPLFDFDADGVVDLVETQWGPKLVARSGADGNVLWTSSQPQYGLTRPAPSVGVDPAVAARHDLNRDGTPDLLLYWTWGYSGDEPVITALSGFNGRLLWRSEATVRRAERASLLEARDLDGDGQPEVICIPPLNYGPKSQLSNSSNDASLWLLVMSGRTGKTLFAELLLAHNPAGPSLDLRSLWFEPSYADLNGDKVLDLIVPAITKDSANVAEMRAISGKDGAAIWQHPLPKDAQDGLRTALPVLADDLDGDGKAEVVIGGITEVPDGRYATMQVIRLLAVDGASGELRWQHDAPADRYFARADEENRLANRPRPVVVRRGDQEKWLALLACKSSYGLTLFDAQGKIVGQRALQPPTGNSLFPYRLWTCDPDGDGRDELVLFDGDTLQLVPADKLDQPLWQSRRQEWVYGAVQGVLHEAPGGPQLVMRGKPGDIALFGISAATGEKLWTCPAPNMVGDNWATLLRGPSDGQPPIAHYAWNNVSLVRDGVFIGAQRELAANTKVELPPVGQDPRLLRSLPWAISEDEAWRRLRSILWSMFYGITMLGIPVAYLGSLVYRRRWGLRTMLMLPLVAGLFLMGVLTSGDNRSLLGKVDSFVVAVPIMLALVILGRWAWRKQWKPMGIWIAMGPLLALVVIAVLLTGIYPKHEGPLEPGERWSWEGWYWVFVYAYFGAAWAMIVLLPPWWLARWLRQRRLAPQS